MGARGPAPKRAAERRRRNKDSAPESVDVAGPVEQPEPMEDWHPVAKGWYLSLADSGQAQFYEPSDWALAQVLAESMSREFKPQVVGVTVRDDGSRDPIWADVPIKGASLSAYLKGMTNLMVSEGDRRRAQLEIERGVVEAELPADVTAISDYRKSLAG